MSMRDHPEIVAHSPSVGGAVPREFAREVRRAQRLEARKQRDPRAIVPLIELYEQMARRLQPGEYPLLYARIQASLGDAYNTLSTGDRAANLERAIASYQEALRFYTPESAPLEYARVQTNLGIAYGNLPTGDPRVNLERAVVCYQEVLRFYTPE